MIDHRERQNQQVNRESRAFIEEANQETFMTRTKAKAYPPGSVFMWSLGAVFGPEGSAKKKERA